MFFILSILRSYTHVEDAAQETFIRVYQNAGQFEEKSTAKTWIFSIAKNLCLDTLKKESKISVQANSTRDRCDFSLQESNEALRCLEDSEQQIMALYAFGGIPAMLTSCKCAKHETSCPASISATRREPSQGRYIADH